MAFIQYGNSTNGTNQQVVLPGFVRFYKATANKTRKTPERKYFMAFHPLDRSKVFGEMCYAALYYDPELKRIGIKPCAKNKYAMKLRSSQFQPWIYLSGFVRLFCLKIDTQQTSPLAFSPADDMWVVQL